MIVGGGGRLHRQKNKLELHMHRAQWVNSCNDQSEGFDRDTTGSGANDGYNIFEFYRQAQQHKMG